TTMKGIGVEPDENAGSGPNPAAPDQPAAGIHSQPTLVDQAKVKEIPRGLHPLERASSPAPAAASPPATASPSRPRQPTPIPAAAPASGSGLTPATSRTTATGTPAPVSASG